MKNDNYITICEFGIRKGNFSLVSKNQLFKNERLIVRVDQEKITFATLGIDFVGKSYKIVDSQGWGHINLYNQDFENGKYQLEKDGKSL